MGLSKEDTIGVIAAIVGIVLIALLIGLLILVMLLQRRLDKTRQHLLALLKKNSHNNVRPMEDQYDYCKAAQTTIVDNGDQEDTTSNCIKSTVVDVQVHLSANECYSHIRNNSIMNDNTYEIIDYVHADRMHLPDHCYPEEQHADDQYMPLSELTLSSETCYASIITTRHATVK